MYFLNTCMQKGVDWNIMDGVTNHVTSKQVHDLTINTAVLKLSCTGENTVTISMLLFMYKWKHTLAQSKTVCFVSVRDERHINLVQCHIGVSFTFC